MGRGSGRAGVEASLVGALEPAPSLPEGLILIKAVFTLTFWTPQTRNW